VQERKVEATPSGARAIDPLLVNRTGLRVQCEVDTETSYVFIRCPSHSDLQSGFCEEGDLLP
jgi:hypothetical protein